MWNSQLEMEIHWPHFEMVKTVPQQRWDLHFSLMSLIVPMYVISIYWFMVLITIVIGAYKSTYNTKNTLKALNTVFMLCLSYRRFAMSKYVCCIHSYFPWEVASVMHPLFLIRPVSWSTPIITSLYIYYYTRNAWVLPRRCSVYIYNSQTNDIANYSNSYGKNNKGIRDY